MLKPLCYVTSQPVYLQSFLPCFYASKFNVPVLYLGLTGRLMQPSGELVYQVCRGYVPTIIKRPENSVLISNGFNYGERRSQSRQQALSQIFQRISGAKLDPLLYYMKSHPYSIEPSLNRDLQDILASANFNLLDTAKEWILEKDFVVIFMHDFNDNHFHSRVLPDFATSYYHWLKLTLDFLHSNCISYVIKLHPGLASDPMSERSSAVLHNFCRLSHYFTSPINLVTALTTSQLIERGMSLGVTVRGTIATELVMLGIPVICAGYPPYQNFIPRRIVTDLPTYTSTLANYELVPRITSDEIDSMTDYLAISLGLPIL